MYTYMYRERRTFYHTLSRSILRSRGERVSLGHAAESERDTLTFWREAHTLKRVSRFRLHAVGHLSERGGGLGSRPIFKKFNETYAPS